MLRISSRILPFAVTIGLPLCLCLGLAAPVGLGACATSQKAYVDDEGGLDGGDDGGLTEGGPLEDGGPSEGGGDAGPGGPRISCGSTFCRSDQKCVQNACTFDCAGTKVPGDYANVTSAVSALAATGADITICVGAVQAGVESVSISDPGNHNKTLKIIGVTPLQVTFASVSVGTGFSDVTLEGFGTSSTMSVNGATKATLRALKLASTSSYALQLRGGATTTPTSITVDGCDIGASTTSGYGIYVDNSQTSPFSVNIVNSYIHGGAYGIYTSGSNTQLQLGILNNTIDKTASYGLFFSTGPTSQVGYVNNIISNSTQYGVYVATGMTAVTHANNALFGNMTNYSGIAVAGAGYVTSDCMYDTSAGVPQTKAGSPCRGAGKDQGAPPVDYWNAPRSGKIDIGAVQGP